jgi:uncharacterized membrane protein
VISPRKSLAARHVGENRGFRWRGGTEISRLEGLSDAVFAFAITLLVVSLEVPKTYPELVRALQGFLAFAICFVLLFAIWYQQYVFFRRYGMEDMTVVVLNATLIFVVLFYVYPLKFVFSQLISQVFGLPPPAAKEQLTAAQSANLFVIFSGGYVAVFVLFALLFGHAYRKRRELELNELEAFGTRESIWSAILQAAVGAASIAIALAAPPRLVGLAGLIYFVSGPVQAVRGTVFGVRRRKLEAPPRAH